MAVQQLVISEYADETGIGQVGISYDDQSRDVLTAFARATGDLEPVITIFSVSNPNTRLIDARRVTVEEGLVTEALPNNLKHLAKQANVWWSALPDGWGIDIQWVSRSRGLAPSRD